MDPYIGIGIGSGSGIGFGIGIAERKAKIPAEERWSQQVKRS